MAQEKSSGAKRATGRPPMAASAVFTLFALAGAGSLYYQLSDRPAPHRAVTGSPTSAPRPAAGGKLPEGHPALELPKQIVSMLDELQSAADAAPDDLQAWQRLARGYYRAGLLDPQYHERAMKALDRMLELDPNNREALRLYGNVAHDTRQFERAEKYFTRYLDLDPGDPGVKTDLASTWLFVGRTDDAARAYREVIEASPDFMQAHVNLGIALHSMGETDEALASLRRGRDLATTDEQRQRIDQIMASAGGATVAPSASAAAPATPGVAAAAPVAPGPPAAAPAAPRAAAPAPVPSTNAETAFQTSAGGLLTGHRIVGPRIVSIDWSSPSAARVELRGFPMDMMPPVMRNKFKSGMNEQLAAMAEKDGVDTPIRIELVDEASDTVMDVLDGKEWVGAFDQDAYE